MSSLPSLSSQQACGGLWGPVGRSEVAPPRPKYRRFAAILFILDVDNQVFLYLLPDQLQRRMLE